MMKNEYERVMAAVWARIRGEQPLAPTDSWVYTLDAGAYRVMVRDDGGPEQLSVRVTGEMWLRLPKNGLLIERNGWVVVTQHHWGLVDVDGFMDAIKKDDVIYSRYGLTLCKVATAL